jgi:predicted Fe-Mo cluster-binding NifX family protein
MKVAISSTAPKLDAPLDQRFGRCPYFIVVDPQSEKFEVLNNQAAMMSGGAGIQAAQMVVNSGAGAVITGHLGPNAADTLAAGGVKTYLGASGTVREAMQQYKAGQLQESSGPTVESHFSTGGVRGGTGAGGGMGRGKGGGRGMGRGMGGGSGRGSRSGRGLSMGRGMGGSRDRGQKRGRRQ